MLEKLKNISIITKLFYLFAVILFIVWVIPEITSYYSNVKSYQDNNKKIKALSLKYDITKKTEKFSEATFLKKTKLLFSHVTVKNLGNKKYEILINMKEKDLKKFRNFIETLSLHYYVKLKDNLEFNIKDKTITAKIRLTTF